MSLSPLQRMIGQRHAHRPGASAGTQVQHLGSGPDSSGKPNSNWWPKMNSQFPVYKSKLAPMNCKELVLTGSHVVYQNLTHTHRLLKNHRSLQKHLPMLWSLYSTQTPGRFAQLKTGQCGNSKVLSRVKQSPNTYNDLRTESQGRHLINMFTGFLCFIDAEVFYNSLIFNFSSRSWEVPIWKC